LRDAIVNHFDKSMPGFLCEEGLLHAVETRTSSPVRTIRETPILSKRLGSAVYFQLEKVPDLREGIVSAAVDGIVVAEAVLKDLVGSGGDESRSWRAVARKSL
jgi:uncharacterized FAD-dependent dehydrogenase